MISRILAVSAVLGLFVSMPLAAVGPAPAAKTADAAPAAAVPAAAPAAAADAPASRQYTFAWQFVEGGELAPRGGTTRGTPITLDTEASEGWRSLQEPGIDAFERDRRAILAMTGGYRASFDFIEVAGFTPGFKPSRPYQSWGTEKVVVLEDRGTFISLQHMLVMSIIGKDGKMMGPFVTKHWRQDWQYEPTHVFRYRGAQTWEREAVDPAAAKGAWSQSVYQVDDSPRYADVARWQHAKGYSAWESPEGWRPLPRREYSVRSDYQVLAGTNRHVIVPTGWVHEQFNHKVALASAGTPRTEEPILAREYGFNRYERIRDYDFAPADAYLKATDPMWKLVRAEWAALLGADKPVVLRAAPDQGQLFMPLFKLASEIEEGKGPKPRVLEKTVRKEVEGYLLKDGETPSTAPAKY